MNRQQRLRAIEDEQSFGVATPDDYASATAVRPLAIGGVRFKRGSSLSREILVAMAPRNLRAMVANNFIELHIERKESPNANRHRP